jgi:peptidoglycan endopeptidase LytE
MKTFSLFLSLTAAAVLISGCVTGGKTGPSAAAPSGNAYGNPQGYAGRSSGYPSDSDYVQVAPVPSGGGAYQAPKYPEGGASKSHGSSASGSSYTVQKGDTLYGISRRNSTNVAALKSANNLSSDTIRPGQVLRIP